jgi:hypothetical protein
MQRAPSPPVTLGSSLILYLFKEPTGSVQRPIHRMDGMEFHFRQTQDLCIFSKMLPVLGPTQPHIQWLPKLFPRVKSPGSEIDHSPTSSV